MMGRWLGALGISVLIAIVLATAPVRSASAHAILISAEPAPGQTLAQAPGSIRIVFSEPLNGPLSGIDLFRSAGSHLEVLSGGVDPADPRAYVVTLPPLAPDRYTVLWRTISLVDGHSRHGSYTFTVLEAGGAAPSVTAGGIHPSQSLQTPLAFDAAAKWLALVGLFLMTGPLLLGLLARFDGGSGDLRDDLAQDQAGHSVVPAPRGRRVTQAGRVLNPPLPDTAPNSGGQALGPLRAARLRRTLPNLALEGWMLAMTGAGILLLLLGSAGQLFGVWLPAGGIGSAHAVLLGQFGLWWLVRAASALLFLAELVWASRRPPLERLMQDQAARSAILLVGAGLKPALPERRTDRPKTAKANTLPDSASVERQAWSELSGLALSLPGPLSPNTGGEREIVLANLGTVQSSRDSLPGLEQGAAFDSSSPWRERAGVRANLELQTLSRVVLLAIIALSFSATSHAAASSRPLWGVAFDSVHIVSAAVWIGSLGALVLVFALPAHGDSERILRRRILSRFSVVAGVSAAAVLLSGAGNSAIELARPSDLVSTGYGRALLTKGALVLLLLAAAAVNALLVRAAVSKGADRGRVLRWTLLTEALLGFAVLVPAALMTVQTPARPEDQASAQARAISADTDPANLFQGNTQLSGISIALAITPGVIGANQARVDISGAVTAEAADLSLSGPDSSALQVRLPRVGLSEDAGSPHTIFEGVVELRGTTGAWQATVALPGVSGSSPPLLVPVGPPSRSAPGGLAMPAGGWFLVIAIALGAVVTAAATRALRASRMRVLSRAFAGAGLAAALGLGVALALSANRSAALTSWGSSHHIPAVESGAFETWRIPTAKSGLMIPAVGPDGAVWIAEMDTNKLARLTPPTNTVTEFVFPGGYQSAMGVAVDAAGRVWIAQEDADAIGHFDPATGDYRSFQVPTPIAAPSGLAVAADGGIWFTELSAGKIGRLDPTSGAFEEFKTPSPDSAPYWLAVAPDGNVWFTELSAKRLGVVDPATKQVREYPLTPGRSPTGIAVDSDGTVWAATAEGALIGLNPATGRLAQFTAPEKGLYGLALGADGRLWIGSASGSAALSFDPTSMRFQMYPAGAGAGPWWPAVGSSGDVWFALASNDTNGLARLSPKATGRPDDH